MRFLCALVLAAGFLSAAVKLGKPLTLKQATPIQEIKSAPDRYVGKTLQVKGKITEVCQMMGCWMNLVDASGNSLRIKVKDGEIVFPKDSPGKMATAEGKLAKIELTREQAVAQAKHEAEENGKKFDPESIKGGTTVYQIQGTGAIIE